MSNMMQKLAKKSLRKWTILVILGLVVYFSGWVFGSRSRNLEWQKSTRHAPGGELLSN